MFVFPRCSLCMSVSILRSRLGGCGISVSAGIQSTGHEHSMVDIESYMLEMS
jgi:hypothetical protein